MLKKLGQYIPSPLKPMAKRLYSYGAAREVLEADQELLPPEKLMECSKQEFIKIGEAVLTQLVNIVDLKPNANILDIGCGSGRIAIPLTRFLSSEGTYEGIDVIPFGVRWCASNITPRFPNFHFSRFDVHNKMYNPSGKVRDSEFRLPYSDGAFDFVLLNSVFTHILTEGVQNYLRDIARVLKVNGRCFITYFLIDDDTARLLENGLPVFKFRFKYDEVCFFDDQKTPELAVAFKEDFIRRLYKDNCLDIIEPIHFGSWRRGKNSTTFQDIVLARALHRKV